MCMKSLLSECISCIVDYELLKIGALSSVTVDCWLTSIVCITKTLSDSSGCAHKMAPVNGIIV